MTNLTYQEEVVRNRPADWDYVSAGSFQSFSFEEIDLAYWPEFASRRYLYALYAMPIYLITIFGLKSFMAGRSPFKLKFALFLWNLSLGMFSIFGFLRTAPTMLHVLQKEDGFFHSVCTREDMSVPMGFWIISFCLSKFLELGDTVFIVLRKRPLTFLQWFHHIATLIVTWLVAPLAEPVSRYYIVLNYGVHALMYPYFALKGVGVNLPRPLAKLITTLQLSQMIIAFFVNVLSVVLLQMGYKCSRHPNSIRGFMLLYGAFILLFGKLFVDIVLKKKREQVSKKLH